MLRKLSLTLLFTSGLWLIAWNGLLLPSPQASAAFTPSALPGAALIPSPAHTDTRRVEVLKRYNAENPFVHDLAIEGDYIWSATGGDGVVRWNRANGTVTQYNTAAGLVHNAVRTVFLDRRGNKWFGTEFGASEFYNGVWITYLSDNSLADFIFTVYHDNDGNIWFGTLAGVLEYNGTNYNSYTTADGLVFNEVRVIFNDSKGNMWFGTQFGVSKFDGTTWKTYNSSNGLSSDWVTAITEDKEGRIWFGTVNKGISILELAQ